MYSQKHVRAELACVPWIDLDSWTGSSQDPSKEPLQVIVDTLSELNCEYSGICKTYHILQVIQAAHRLSELRRNAI